MSLIHLSAYRYEGEENVEDVKANKEAVAELTRLTNDTSVEANADSMAETLRKVTGKDYVAHHETMEGKDYFLMIVFDAGIQDEEGEEYIVFMSNGENV